MTRSERSRTLAGCLALLTCCGAAGAQAAPSAPVEMIAEDVRGLSPLRVDMPQVDFGVVDPGKLAFTVLVVKNVSDHLVRATAVSSSCECTRGILIDTEIEPGGETLLEVRFDAPASPGWFARQYVRVHLAGDDTSLVVPVTAMVRANIEYSVKDVVDEGRKVSGVIRVASVDGAGFAVHDVRPEVLGVELPTEEAAQHDLPFTLYAEEGRFPRIVRIGTTLPGQRAIDVPLFLMDVLGPTPEHPDPMTRYVQELLHVDERVLVYAHAAEGEEVVRECTVLGMWDQRSAPEVETSARGFKVRIVEALPDPAGMRLRIGLTPTTTPGGQSDGTIRIVGDTTRAAVRFLMAGPRP